MMKNQLRSFSIGGLLFLFVAMLSGCATPANSGNMTVRAAAATDMRLATPEFLKQGVAIKDVTGGKETNPMWVSNVSSSQFEKAIEDSLRSVGMLSENRQSGRFQLLAHLEKVDQPFLGASMTVTTTVEYELINRATGKSIWKERIVAPYTAQFSDAFLGYERLRLANEGSVRENITRLVSKLQGLKASEVGIN